MFDFSISFRIWTIQSSIENCFLSFVRALATTFYALDEMVSLSCHKDNATDYEVNILETTETI